MIDLHVPPAHRLCVFIWPTVKRVRQEYTRRVGKGAAGMLAFFHSPTTRMTPLGRVKTKTVGEIHLARGEFGIGIFSHELQHFLSHWFVIKQFDLTGRDWERASLLAGRLQKEFWNKFYKLGLE